MMPMRALSLAALLAAPAGGFAAAEPVSIHAAARESDSTLSRAAADALSAWTLVEADSSFVAPEGAGVLDVAGLAVDAFGRVFATDAMAHRLARFGADHHWLGAEGTLGSGEGQFRRPGAIAIHGTLEVAVLDRENRRVTRYDFLGHWKGVLVDLADAALEQRVGRVDAVDLACDRGGAPAVADRDGERVLLFDVSGEFLRTLGGYGDRPGSFRGISGVAFTPRGDLLVTERTARRLQQLDPGGRPIHAWRLPAASGSGAIPVAARADGAMAAADEVSGALWLWDADGRLRVSQAGLAAPRALAFAPDGALLVAEGAPSRIRRFRVVTSGDSARAE